MLLSHACVVPPSFSRSLLSINSTLPLGLIFSGTRPFCQALSGRHKERIGTMFTCSFPWAYDARSSWPFVQTWPIFCVSRPSAQLKTQQISRLVQRFSVCDISLVPVGDTRGCLALAQAQACVSFWSHRPVSRHGAAGISFGQAMAPFSR